MRLPTAIFSRRPTRQRGFTLVEIMATLAVACLLLLSVALVAVMSAKVMRKNVLAGDAITATRLFQEHLNREITSAVIAPPGIPPTFTGNDTNTPPRSSRLTYRIIIGPNARIASDAAQAGTTVTLTCPAALKPQIGDYLISAKPDFGDGAVIAAVDDTRAAGADGDVNLTLAQTIISATVAGSPSDMITGDIVTIQRQRAYQTYDSTKYPGLV